MKKHNFAYTENISSNYAGELARPYVAAALLAGVTLDQRTITVLENVKYKANLGQIGTTNLLQDATCDFTLDANGTVDYSERILTPVEMQVNARLCKNDWVQQWEAVNMGAGRKDHTIAPNISQFLLGEIAKKVAQEVEYHIWQGTDGTGTYQRFDGFVTIAEAAGTAGGFSLYEGGAGASDATIPDLTLTGGGNPIDADDVIEVFEQFLSQVSTAVLSKEDFTIYANQKVLYALRRAQAALGYKDDYYERQGELTSFLGYRVAPAFGLTDTHIVASPASNLFFGTDLLSDHIEANVIDMAQTDGSNQIRIVMRMTGGVQVGVPSDYYAYKYEA